MLCASDYTSSDLRPIDLVIQLLIDLAYNRDVVSSHQVQPVGNFRTRLWIVLWSNDALDGVTDDQVSLLVK